MGASTFSHVGRGTTAKDAFRELVGQSRDEDGDEYSGGIGMKHDFVMVSCPNGKDPNEHAEALLESDERIGDKHGPAGCIKLEEGKWLFFGWASS